MSELMVTWTKDRFKLELYDEHTYPTRLAYKFYLNNKVLFEGNEYRPSPMHSIDGKESIFGLLAFLSLRPGDTDDDYFKDYTPEQLEFCETDAEELSLLVNDWEYDDETKTSGPDKEFSESNFGCTLTNEYFGTIQY